MSSEHCADSLCETEGISPGQQTLPHSHPAGRHGTRPAHTQHHRPRPRTAWQLAAAQWVLSAVLMVSGFGEGQQSLALLSALTSRESNWAQGSALSRNWGLLRVPFFSPSLALPSPGSPHTSPLLLLP